jgi:hypothetical protein
MSRCCPGHAFLSKTPEGWRHGTIEDVARSRSRNAFVSSGRFHSDQESRHFPEGRQFLDRKYQFFLNVPRVELRVRLLSAPFSKSTSGKEGFEKSPMERRFRLKPLFPMLPFRSSLT